MSTSEKKQSKKAWEEAYETLEQLIMDSQLTPGEAITEDYLAERLGVSRTPIREAIKRLEEKGLIVSSNGRKRVHLLTIQEMEEMFDIKICLEGRLVRWAVERGSEQAFGELGAIVAEMRSFVENSAGDEQREESELQEWLIIDRRLHQLVFQMANAPKTERIIHNLNLQWHRLKIGSLTLQGRMHRSIQEHESFVRAILDKDADEAERCMKSHLETIKREMVKLMTMFQYPAQ